MTQPSLLELADKLHLSFTDRAERLFEASPNTWLHWTVFAQQCGALAWRTRISECRKRGMQIDNKVEQAENGVKHSYYRWTR